MSLAEIDEKLSRAIKVIDLPSDYDADEILSNLSKAGQITEKILGDTEILLIFDSKENKELCKMYNGCTIRDFNLRLIDPTSLEVKRVQKSFGKMESHDMAASGYNVVTKNHGQDSDSDFEIVEDSEEEENKKKQAKQTVIEGVQPTIEFKKQISGNNGLNLMKSLLKELQSTNLPQKAKLPEGDVFNELVKAKYFIYFSALWGFVFFVTSVF